MDGILPPLLTGESGTFSDQRSTTVIALGRFQNFIQVLTFNKRIKISKEGPAIGTQLQRGKSSPGIVEVVNSDTNLLEVIGTLHTPCRFPGRLNRRQKKGNQNTNDGNNDQKFHQGKSRQFAGISICSLFHDMFLLMKGGFKDEQTE